MKSGCVKGRAMVIAAVMLSLSAGAGEEPDYYSYDALVTNCTCVGLHPAAECWTSGQPMDDGTDYLIPKDRTLTSQTSTSNPGDAWPGRELAVAGELCLSVGNKRDWAPTLPPLVLLPNGKIVLDSVLAVVKSQSLEIRGSVSSPSVIDFTGKQGSFNKNYYASIDAPVTGEEDSCLVLKHSKNAAYDQDRAYRAKGGFAGFAGRLVVDGVHTWLCDTDATNLDIAGSLVLTNGATLWLSRLTPTVGTLSLGGSTRVLLQAGAALSVTHAFAFASDARIVVTNFFPASWSYSSAIPAPVRVLSFAAGVARPSDYGSLVEVLRPVNAIGSVPSWYFAEEIQADGSVDVMLVCRPVAWFTNGCTMRPDSKNPDYSMLSDYEDGVPYVFSADKDYLSNGETINLSDGNVEFGGHTLTIVGGYKEKGRMCIYSGLTFTAQLYLVDNARIGQVKTKGSACYDGDIYLESGYVAIGGDNKGVEIRSRLHGQSDLAVKRNGVVNDDTDMTKTAYLYLKGDNGDFTGRISFGDHAGTNAELSVWNKSNLGGPRASFTADALSIADTCKLLYRGTGETFDDTTRGWTFEGASELSVVSDVSLRVMNRITVAPSDGKPGELVKSGPGRLLVADVDGSSLTVSEGLLGAAAADAMTGLSSLAFAKGTGWTVDAATADEALATKGVDLSATELKIPADGLPVSFSGVTAPCTVAVATFASQADAEKFVLKRPRGYVVDRIVEPAEGGKVVLKAELSKSGLLFLVK